MPYKDPNKKRAWDRAYAAQRRKTPNGKKAYTAASLKWNMLNPEKYRAIHRKAQEKYRKNHPEKIQQMALAYCRRKNQS